MWTYIIRRILIFIPTLIIISLMGFVISINAPGDPVERLVNTADNKGAVGANTASNEKLKQQIREKLGLHLPIFYLSLTTMADTDTLYKIPDRNQRSAMSTMILKYGNWGYIADYYDQIKSTVYKMEQMNLDSVAYQNYPRNEVNEVINKAKFTLLSLLEETKDKRINEKIDKVKNLLNEYGFLEPVAQNFRDVEQSYIEVISNTAKWKTYVPAINFYGLDNQYHNWITGIVTGLDFGISYRDQQPVISRIKSRFIWSFSLAILSIIFAYIVSIPIGIYAAYKRNSFFDRASATTLFALISLPNFFVGVLLLFLFANPDILSWFPSSGVMDAATFNDDWPLWRKISHHAPYLILPFFTYAYSSFAFLSRQMRVGMLEIINQDYIRTARAKGLSERTVVLKHALRNGLLPIITLFANIFPLALSGSVIIEKIFSIPGMGLEIYQSILNSDYPMIVAVFTIVGFLTLVGYLVSDILYAVVDPRISYR